MKPFISKLPLRRELYSFGFIFCTMCKTILHKTQCILGKIYRSFFLNEITGPSSEYLLKENWVEFILTIQQLAIVVDIEISHRLSSKGELKLGSFF